MPNGDPFHALEQLALAQDIQQLWDRLHDARTAGRELYALKLGERRSYSARMQELMARVDGNVVFRDPRAARALQVLADLYARLA